ncbi:MAG: hypothetical protein V1719_02935 [Patescibacteria group bacterium]
MRAIILVCLSLFLLGCGDSSNNNSNNQQPECGSGQLYKLSGQSFVSSKKILFIHGRFMADTTVNGQTQATVESLFASKLDQLNYACSQATGQQLSQCVEVWFYTYNTHQNPPKVAEDLVGLIQNHPDWRDSQICLVGHSEGGLVSWIVDQRYQLIDGAVIIGAPILGSPLADQPKVEAAVNQKWGPGAQGNIHKIVSWLLNGSDDLVNGYPETGQAKSEIMLFAGQINLPSVGFTRYAVDAMYTALDSQLRYSQATTSNRRVAQLGGIIIDLINQDNINQQTRVSDGIIPVTSATFGSNNFRVWEDYDHYNLLGGKNDLFLDQATFDWVDHVLHLRSQFAGNADIPNLPNNSREFPSVGIPELPEISLNVPTTGLLSATKFAYILNGQLILADSSSVQQANIAGNNMYPRFSTDGSCLVWTQQIGSNYGIYLLDNNGVSPVTDGWYGSLSPDGSQLIFQRADKLLIRDISTDVEAVVVSGVNLTSPPVWWESLLASRIYFAHQSGGSKTSLYWVSSSARNVQLSSANLVAGDCDVIFPFHGYISGVAAATTTSQASKLWLVAGLFGQDLSLEFQSGVNQPEFVTNGAERTFKLDQTCQFDSVVTDWATGLYLTGSLNGQDGIYYLDIAKLTSATMGWGDIFSSNSQPAPQLAINDVLKLVVPGGTQLDIKSAPD